MIQQFHSKEMELDAYFHQKTYTRMFIIASYSQNMEITKCLLTLELINRWYVPKLEYYKAKQRHIVWLYLSKIQVHTKLNCTFMCVYRGDSIDLEGA